MACCAVNMFPYALGLCLRLSKWLLDTHDSPNRALGLTTAFSFLLLLLLLVSASMRASSGYKHTRLLSSLGSHRDASNSSVTGMAVMTKDVVGRITQGIGVGLLAAGMEPCCPIQVPSRRSVIWNMKLLHTRPDGRACIYMLGLATAPCTVRVANIPLLCR